MEVEAQPPDLVRLAGLRHVADPGLLVAVAGLGVAQPSVHVDGGVDLGVADAVEPVTRRHAHVAAPVPAAVVPPEEAGKAGVAEELAVGLVLPGTVAPLALVHVHRPSAAA